MAGDDQMDRAHAGREARINARVHLGVAALLLVVCAGARCDPGLAAGETQTEAAPAEAAAPVASQAPPAETNLLRLPGAQIQNSTAGLDDTASLPLLSDGDAATVASFKTGPGLPVDVVYGFGDSLVTAERLNVQLPESSGVARVEILVSTLSAQSGFRSVRAERLTAQPDRQEFQFQPSGARWIMLRFTPAANCDVVEVAEVSVMGYAGAPSSNYAFKQTPAAALEVLKGMGKLSGVDLSVSDDERSLFTDISGGEPHHWSVEEAALIVSGAHTAQERVPYLDKLAQLEADADKATSGARDAFDRGDRLLRWLYRRGYLKHYQIDKTDLTALLDTGGYNCVSSALLYMLVARHLGLDVRAIEVPDHAFVVLYDGLRHVDVETTAAAGFNPDADAAAAGNFRRLTGLIRPSSEKPELRREVGGVGLLGAVYYNHGVADSLAHRYSEALAEYFRALSIDAESANAVKNSLSAIGAWGAELAKAQDFPTAVKELGIGLVLAPDDAQLNYISTAAWQMWANSEIQAGHTEQALAVLRDAAQAMPKSHFEDLQTWVYASPAQELANRSDWQGAIAIVDPARAQLHGQQLIDIENYEAWLYNQQGLALVDRRDWQGARILFDAGSKRLPNNAALKQNTIYCWSHVWIAKAEAGDYQSALANADQAAARFPGQAEIHRAREVLWLNWSKTALDARDWFRGIDICQRGLKYFPGDPALGNNERVGWNKAAQDRYDAKQWPEAIDVLMRARARYPDDKGFQNNELAVRMAAIKSDLDRNDCGTALPQIQSALLRFPGETRLIGVRGYCSARAGKP